jgi:hypothetical protein
VIRYADEVTGNEFKSIKVKTLTQKFEKNNQNSDAKYYLYPVKHADSWQYPNPTYNSTNQGESINKMITKYGSDNKVRRLMSATQRKITYLDDSAEIHNCNRITCQKSKVLNQVSSLTKKLLKPSVINKEELYERVIKLKTQLNYYKHENVRLQTQLKYAEKSSLEKEGIIEEYFMIIKSRQGKLGNITYNKKNVESYLTTTLKRQIKDLKRIIREKEIEITSYKKNPTSAKISELLEIVRVKEKETLEWRRLAEKYRERIDNPKATTTYNVKYNETSEIQKELYELREQNHILRSKTGHDTHYKIDEINRKHEEFIRTINIKLIDQRKDNVKLQEEKNEILKKFGGIENIRNRLDQEISLRQKVENLYRHEKEKNYALRKYLKVNQIPEDQIANLEPTFKNGSKIELVYSGENQENQFEREQNDFYDNLLDR